VVASRCSTIIENTFRRSGSWRRLKGELSVYYWPRVAGTEIAKNVVAERYFNGYLYLKTESATLAHQLTMMNCDIVKRYQKILGHEAIKGVKIKVGSVAPVPKDGLPENIPKLDESEQRFIAANCASIGDPELSDRFKAIMEKAFLNKHRIQAAGSKICLSCNVVIDSQYDYCPICELKLKEEMFCYINYLKKHHQEIDLSKLPIEINEANTHLIRQMLRL
jgi:RNA polymerase subunit RPABC4/transcription elongation factor Spt4